jgi:signal transduction histidine kinase
VDQGSFSFLRSLSLRWRLSIAFAGIAVLTAGVVGAILIPILSSHYQRAEQTYLEAAAERAVRDLGALSWKKNSTELQSLVEDLAVITQTRVRVSDPSGAVLADSGSPADGERSGTVQPLPDPLGGGIFDSGSATEGALRSDQTIQRPVERNGRLQGSVQLSEAPGYARAALVNTAKAWGLAGLIGVVIAIAAGWLAASRLSKPIIVLTEASNRMAGGQLGVRAAVERGDEVGRLARSFNSMASRVEETVTSLRRFVADAAHEIGTPLTALQADLDIAQSHADPQVRERFVEHAAVQARRLEYLTSSLLRLSRLEAGDLPQDPRPVNINALAREVLDAFASRADQAEIDLRYDLPDNELVVFGHADRLQTAIGNLLDNALKFTPNGGVVTLGLRQNGDQARLWVSDTGIGIPPEDVAGLFSRFHRGRNVHDYPGSGLGLAIVKATAELHRGSVAGGNNSPKGARFELSLPLSFPEGPANHAARTS